MVSADGGKSWGEAALDEPRLPKAFTRFSMAWRRDGGYALPGWLQGHRLEERAFAEGRGPNPATKDDTAALVDTEVI
jgi:hypothetical protein